MDDFENFDPEEFDEQEFERIAKLRQRKNLKSISEFIDANKDERNKTVGDKIFVWDSSRLTDYETGKVEYDVKIHSILNNYPSIVIDDHRKFTSEVRTFAGDFTKNLDLVIWNKTLNRRFRTSSEFVKLYEPQYQDNVR